MACLIIRNQSLIWGGSDGDTVLSGPPLVYDITKNQWTSSYSAPPYYLNAGHSSMSSSVHPSSTSSTSTGRPSVPNLAVILEGSLGGLFVVVLVGAVFFYKKNNTSRRKYDSLKNERLAGGYEYVNVPGQINRAKSLASVVDGGFTKVDLGPNQSQIGVQTEWALIGAHGVTRPVRVSRADTIYRPETIDPEYRSSLRSPQEIPLGFFGTAPRNPQEPPQ